MNGSKKEIVELDTLLYWLKKNYEIVKMTLDTAPGEAYVSLRLKVRDEDGEKGDDVI